MICLGSSHRSIIACAFRVCVIVCNVTFICFSDYRRLNAHGCFVRRLWDFRSRQALFFAVVIALCSRCSLSVRVCVADSLLSPFRLQMSGVSASCSLICTSPFFVFGSLELASRVGSHRAPTYSLVRRRASDRDRKAFLLTSTFFYRSSFAFSVLFTSGVNINLHLLFLFLIGFTHSPTYLDHNYHTFPEIYRLYHHNLWQDTFEGDEFFGAFRQHPVTFLMERSPGMTRDVAEFLANRVFRILPDCPSTDADTDPEAWAKYEHDVARERVSARELGEWVRNLPALFYSNTSGAAGSGNMETPVAIVTAATPDSRRSSLRDVIAADFTHSPDCVYNQLQEAATDAVDVEDEDEDEVEADKTFTQMDATQGFFENDDDVEDYGIVLRTGAFAVSGLTPNTQSFPPTSNSIHRSPRFHPPSSPLPSEPMPLAQPVKFVDSNASDLVTSNGECVACSHDEHLGLGLSCAMNPGEGEGEVFKAGPFSVRSRRRGQRRKKDASISGPGAGASSIPPSAFSSPNPASILSLPPTHLDDLAQDTQNLARELSRAKPPTISQPRSTSCGRSRAPTVSHTTAPPIPSLPTSPSAVGKIAPSPLDFPVIDPSTPSLPPSVAAVVAPTKKSSKWNLLGSWRDRDNDHMAVSERAASILKGLDSTYHPSSSSSTSGGSKSQTSSSSSNYSSFDSSGSAHRFSVASSASTAATTVSSSSSIAFVPPPLAQHLTSPTSAGPDGTPWRERLQHPRSGWDSTSPPSRNGLHERWDRSPVSGTHSGRSNATTLASWRKDQNGSVPTSAASSVYNNLSGGSSSASSTFTRLGNGSEMSFSTTATTISASSGFNVGGTAGVLGQQLRDKKSQSTLNRPPHKANSPPQAKQQRSGLPPNIKRMWFVSCFMKTMY